jgi:hypothetical protein
LRTMFFTKGRDTKEQFVAWLEAIHVADDPHVSAMLSETFRNNPAGVDVWATSDRGHVQWMCRWCPGISEYAHYVDWCAWSHRSSRITSCVVSKGALALLT